MVFDCLKNCEQYYSLHPLFEKAFDFIKKAEKEQLPVGKYELEGKALYAMVQEYDSKVPEAARNEGHRNYIDIQYVCSGEEVIEVEDIAKVVSKVEYNPEKDVEFYENAPKAVRCVLGDEDYAILFPHDIHRPGLTFEKTVPVRKVVVKVLAK